MAVWGALLKTAGTSFGKGAATKAITTSGKQAAKGALKTRSVGAAKGMAKDKAIEAVTGRGKKEKGGEITKIEVGGQRGGALVKSKGTTPLIPPSDGGGDIGGDVGGGAVVPSEGGKISFGGINKQIDNIVGLTGTLKNAFETQTNQKENQQKVLRKQLEKQKKAAREELLESKQPQDTPVKGVEKPDKKAGFLGTVWKFLSNIIMGTLVVSFLKFADLAKNIFGRANAGMEALFWGIRSLFLFPKTLLGALKGLRGLLKFSLKAILDPLAKFGKTIFNSLKTAGEALRTFISGKIKAAFEAVKNAGRWASNVVGRGAKWVKGGVDALRKTKAGKAVEGAVKGVRRVGGNLLKGAGGLLRGGNKAIGGGASRLAKGAISTVTAPIKAVSGGIKAVTGTASKVAGKAGSLVKTAGKTAGKVAGKVSGFVTKLFPGLGKLIAKGAPIFKGMAKAAKGIKIPVIGPLMVAISSLLAGEPLGQVGFKTMGAGIGGALGSLIPIPVLGILVGEIAGEFVGDLAFSLFNGEGMEGVKEKAKKKFQDIVKSGKDIKEFITGGFSRFIESFKKENTNRLGITNWFALLNLGKTFPLLKKSFFPPKGEENSADLGSGGGSKVSDDVKSVSKEDPTQEEGNTLVVTSDSPSPAGGGGAVGGGGGGSSTTPPPILVSAEAIASTLNKQETLGVLYQS